MAQKKVPRLSFSQFVDKAFWGLMTASAIYIATQVRDLSKSVNALNLNVAVMLVQMAANEKRDDAQDKNIDKLLESLLVPRR